MTAFVLGLLPHWKTLLLAITAAVSFGLGVRWQRGAEAIERQALAARQVARAAEIGQDAENKLAKLRERNTNLARRAAHESHQPDYHARLPDAGRVLYNAACCGDPAGEPDTDVRPADAAP